MKFYLLNGTICYKYKDNIELEVKKAPVGDVCLKFHYT